MKSFFLCGNNFDFDLTNVEFEVRLREGFMEIRVIFAKKDDLSGKRQIRDEKLIAYKRHFY